MSEVDCSRFESIKDKVNASIAQFNVKIETNASRK